ncbi:RagB/SusD family nutrient uptake outer membrane protein [Maribacter dokdonensis]|uniref:RagB/SusD domain-containing protein n=1 Tax=Maribacter dokdonensis TaxID=320912 RepID=A0A1H4JN13_9FLAO|nr:RagB/SusD family nutrient uptake outer membrane protein [Maribacter dokdonensis]MBU2901256.1 RagB/SusD family nutrient uptake outer membrane protein [Maribacter dokdonensis]SEB47719.1 RagB/SusD domain-containing protein [Maribacter dokdonensis]
MRKNKFLIILLASMAVIVSSCSSEDLEPTLSQSKSVEGSVTKVDNLYSILKGAHNVLTDDEYYGRDIIATNEVRSDNCFSNGNSGRFSTQSQFSYNSNTGYVWDDVFEMMSNVNIIINTDLSTLEGDLDYGAHIQGQALTLRALGNYDLIRIYGQQNSGGTLGVPIVTTFKGEDLFPSRATVEEVKQAIYADLEMAFSMMDSSYDTSKIIVSKYVAKALEARVAVYFGDWSRAVTASEAVINSGLYSIIGADSYVSSWAADGGSNVLFELAFSGSDNLGSNALSYIYRYPGDEPAGYGDVQAYSDLIDIYDESDVRLGILGYQNGGTALRNMGKYPDTATGSDNIPLFRYEEVILNYAEALFETGGDALTQLNLITSNRGAAAYTSVTKDDILNERRKELVFEGFRFDDLMRTGQSVDATGSLGNTISTLTYPNNAFAWPIPLSEINANSNMVQNEGY